jgi:hypothetical protein
MNQLEQNAAPPESLDYLLRRAEQETIAAIRSTDPRASGSHAQMACAFSARAISMLDAPAPAG